VDRVLRRAWAKDARLRFPSVLDFVAAVDDAVKQASLAAAEVVPVEKRRWHVPAAALALSAAAGVALFALKGPRVPPPPAAVPPPRVEKPRPEPAPALEEAPPPVQQMESLPPPGAPSPRVAKVTPAVRPARRTRRSSYVLQMSEGTKPAHKAIIASCVNRLPIETIRKFQTQPLRLLRLGTLTPTESQLLPAREADELGDCLAKMGAAVTDWPSEVLVSSQIVQEDTP
jgi:hypothetical protein